MNGESMLKFSFRSKGEVCACFEVVLIALGIPVLQLYSEAVSDHSVLSKSDQ